MSQVGTVRAELLKLFSVRATYALIAASAAMGLLVVAGLPPPNEHPAGAALLLELFVAASITYPLVLALGTLLVGASSTTRPSRRRCWSPPDADNCWPPSWSRAPPTGW